jgi:peptidoglycan-N-acetylglucosamine deacetylase
MVQEHSSREAFVTVSVDDGHLTDLRTADLLSKYDIRATFYVPVRNPERPVISKSQMRQIAAKFELGGHTMNHVPLDSVPLDRAWEEISASKAWLEDLLGESVVSFCYPRGKHSARIAAMVKKAGFLGARTCFLNRHDFPADPFMWGVSTQGRNHSRVIQLRHALLERNFRGALNFLQIHKATTDWATHFSHSLDWVEVNGGIAHLYFHSWEIEEAQEWKKLEKMLRAIRERTGVKKVANGELFALWDGLSKRRRQMAPA